MPTVALAPQVLQVHHLNPPTGCFGMTPQSMRLRVSLGTVRYYPMISTLTGYPVAVVHWLGSVWEASDPAEALWDPFMPWHQTDPNIAGSPRVMRGGVMVLGPLEVARPMPGTPPQAGPPRLSLADV
jgi:hypothetical protein